MPSPSLAIRLRSLHAQLDELLDWGTHLPAQRKWAERLNELRLVRATLAWEDFLEQSIVCYLRGSATLKGRTYSLAVAIAPNAVDALGLAIGGGYNYGKWLNETWTQRRASALFSGSAHPYVALADPIFPEIRKVRNRIVHRSDLSRTEFQGIVVSLYGSIKPGMTPGRFLSDLVSGQPRIDIYLSILKTVGIIIVS